MKLVLSVEPDERAADLMAIGALMGFLYGEKQELALVEGWVGFLATIFDTIAQDNSTREFNFSFRRPLRDAFKQMDLVKKR